MKPRRDKPAYVSDVGAQVRVYFFSDRREPGKINRPRIGRSRRT